MGGIDDLTRRDYGPDPSESGRKGHNALAVEHARLMYLVEWVDEWLDENAGEQYKAQPLAQDWARLAKVFEEGAEAMDELTGITSANPRKGLYGSEPDMLKELADTALTAIYAIQHFTKDTRRTMDIVMRTAEYHRERIVGL